VKKKDLGARAPNPRPREELRCMCGHHRNVHTPLLGCIALVPVGVPLGAPPAPWRTCACKIYKSSPAIARAQSAGNAGKRPATQTAGASPGTKVRI